MSIVGGLDLHRAQITFDALDVESCEVARPDLAARPPPIPPVAANRPGRRAGGTAVSAVEGCTGWRYVVEQITEAGFEAHLAEPADTQAARGRKRHANTDLLTEVPEVLAQPTA
jgi:transposase